MARTTANRRSSKRGMTRAAWVGLVLIGLLVLAVLALLLFNWNWLREPIEQRAQEATGRELTIDGDLDVRWGWPPMVVADGVRLGNAAWSDTPYMLMAERVEARVRPLDALRGRWRFPSVTLHQPQLLVEWDEHGISNWDGLVGDDGEDDRPGADIDRLAVLVGTVELRDPARQTHIRLQIDSATVADEREHAIPMDVHGQGRFRGQSFEVSGRVDSPLRIGEPDQGYRIDLRGHAGNTQAQAQGQLSATRPLQVFDLRVQVSGDDLAELDDLVDIGVPSSPPYEIGGRLRRDGPRLSINDMQGMMGRSQWTGRMTVEEGAQRPFVTGTLQASLPLPDNDEVDDERLFPSGDLGAHRLAKIDGDLHLDLTTLGADDRWLRSMQADLSLRDGSGTGESLTLDIGGGRADGAISFDARQTPVRYRVSVQYRGVQVQQLFPDTMLAQATGGRLVGELQVSGQGASVAAIMASLDGEFTLLLGPSQVPGVGNGDGNGFDLASLIGFEGLGDQPITVRCGYADFAIENGVAQARSLAVDTEDTVIVGEGSIHLGDERWDLTLHPRQKDAGFSPLKTPLGIRGPLRAPEVDPGVGPAALRVLATGALAAITPPAALLGMIDPGEGEDLDCSGILGRQ